MRYRLLLPLLLASLLPLSAAPPSPSPERLAAFLKLHPEADTNQDGVLSTEEARAFYQKNHGGAKSGGPASSPAAIDPVTGSPPAQAATAEGVPPTVADAHYGPYERNVLDFWKANAATPAPLVVFIHGGGFVAGDKSKVRTEPLLRQCLAAGVNFAAINYRYRTTAPIQDVLHDCGRAVQYLRTQAAAWNIDPKRIAAYGGSAGAGSSLWLAFHDDLANPSSPDPVLRESSRLCAAGAISTQLSYDIFRWDEIFSPEVVRKFAKPEDDRPAFYGLKTEADLRSAAGAKIRADCDMIGLISPDDPPVFLSSHMTGGEVQSRGQYLHHPLHAQAVLQQCQKIGIPAYADIPALHLTPPPGAPPDLRTFLFQTFGLPAPK